MTKYIVFVLFLIGKSGYSQNADSLVIKHVKSTDYSRFVTQLILNYPQLREGISNSIDPNDLRYERKYIPKSMAIIVYLLGEKNLYIFCATSDSAFAKVVEMDARELRKKILLNYQLLRSPGTSTSLSRGAGMVNSNNNNNSSKKLNNLSNELYKILIGNLRPEIFSKKTLNIISNVDMRIIPFCALVSNISGDSITYLIDEKIILNNNRIRLGINRDSLAFDKMKILAVGNPDYSLPYSEYEVNWIKDRFKNSKVLTGNMAVRDNIVAQFDSVNVIHFATHGFFNYKNYDSSYVLIASDSLSPTNKYLNIISELAEHTAENLSLLVLSACQSAVTADEQGSATYVKDTSFHINSNYGTASSFLSTGIGSVIATLWNINDKSTCKLMENFYNNLEFYSIPEALRKSQIDLRKRAEYRHPYYWAAFAYYGE